MPPSMSGSPMSVYPYNNKSPTKYNPAEYVKASKTPSGVYYAVGKPKSPVKPAPNSMITGLTKSTTAPEPGTECWARRANQDTVFAEERRQLYSELQTRELALVDTEQEAANRMKQERKEKFTKRQEARIAQEAADKEREAMLRKQALGLVPAQGGALPDIKDMWKSEHRRMALDAEGYQTGEAGYGPKQWLWPTAKHHPRQWASAHDVSIVEMGNIIDRAGASDVDQLIEYAQTLEARELEMIEREHARRLERAEDERLAEEKRKEFRDAEAEGRRTAILSTAQVKAKAERDRARKIKAEMAAETKLANETAAKKEAERYAASLQQRKANDEYQRTHHDRLQWRAPPTGGQMDTDGDGVLTGNEVKKNRTAGGFSSKPGAE